MSNVKLPPELEARARNMAQCNLESGGEPEDSAEIMAIARACYAAGWQAGAEAIRADAADAAEPVDESLAVVILNLPLPTPPEEND